jgi:tRNA(Ile)-lysidine synthase
LKIKDKVDHFKKNQNCHNNSGELLNRVRKTLRHHCPLKNGDTVIIAVSGGSDSLALLHILHDLNLNLRLISVYIDHGLRPDETENEKKRVEECSRELNVRFVPAWVDVPRYINDTKCSPEEGARVLRYEALEKIGARLGASAIAVGHTADDQAEEFLLRMIRGSSLKGLSGMRIRRDLIIRPLLSEFKADLTDYLKGKKISFCFDSSNSDRKFLRNRVRLDLMPMLEQTFNPAIKKIILQNMDILAHENDFLQETCDRKFEICVISDKLPRELILLSDRLDACHPAVSRRIIEKCFWQMQIGPGYLQIQLLLQFAQTAESGSELHLEDGVRAVKSSHKVVLSRPLKGSRRRGSAKAWTFSKRYIPGPGKYTIKETGVLLTITTAPVNQSAPAGKQKLVMDMDSLSFPLLLRPPEKGERFRPFNAPGSKKIARYLGEKRIERIKRSGYPVLLSNNEVIALPGLQIAHGVRVTSTTRKTVQIEMRISGEIEGSGRN